MPPHRCHTAFWFHPRGGGQGGAFLFELPPKKPTVGISAPTVAAAKICSLFLKQPRLLIPTACTDMGTCPSI